MYEYSLSVQSTAVVSGSRQHSFCQELVCESTKNDWKCSACVEKLVDCIASFINCTSGFFKVGGKKHKHAMMLFRHRFNDLFQENLGKPAPERLNNPG